ncbi:F-box protein At4g02760-like isoform X2 [Nymphaea colorata]|nr:F-box protein At4g02760-like isoform X2 [Nymphaea colorata]
MLDTRSVCRAAATCSMFNKCAMDSLCYQYIDLTSAETKVNNSVVFAMVQRAAKNLQSLKLGIQPVALRGTRFCQSMVFAAHNPVDTSSFSWHDRRSEQEKMPCFLTRSCLLPLTLGNGAIGGLLRQLHLYNIDAMDTTTLCTALSVCRSLFDFAVVGLNVNLKQTLKSLSSFCPCLEHLFFESSGIGGDESLKSSTCFDIVNGCPLLSSLTLRGFKLNDHKVQILLKGFQHLKLIDFTSAYTLTGIFLRSLSNCGYDLRLEVLILRDCVHLREVEVDKFLSVILQGECKNLRYLDISNKDGLATAGDCFERSYNPSHVSIERVFTERPEVHLVAEFPIDKSFGDLEEAIDGQGGSNDSTPYTLSPMSLEKSFSMGSSDGSYNSDPDSGEDLQDIGCTFYEEFSDGAEYFMP